MHNKLFLINTQSVLLFMSVYIRVYIKLLISLYFTGLEKNHKA